MNDKLAQNNPGLKRIYAATRGTLYLTLNGMKPLASGISALHSYGGLRK